MDYNTVQKPFEEQEFYKGIKCVFQSNEYFIIEVDFGGNNLRLGMKLDDDGDFWVKYSHVQIIEPNG